MTESFPVSEASLMLIFTVFSFVSHDLACFPSHSSTGTAAGEACPWLAKHRVGSGPGASVAPWPGCGQSTSARGNFISSWGSVGWPQGADVSLPSLQAWPKLLSLERGTEATTPMSDWLQGIPNGTSVSLTLIYFIGGADATSLEILLACCRTRFWAASSLTGMEVLSSAPVCSEMWRMWTAFLIVFVSMNGFQDLSYTLCWLMFGCYRMGFCSGTGE